MVVAEGSLRVQFQPVVAEGKTHSLAHRSTPRAVFHRLGPLAPIHVAHRVGHAPLRVGVHSEALVTAQSRVEVEGCTAAPVAVHVLRSGHSAACHLVVLRAAAHTVLCGMEIHVGSISPLQFGETLSVVGMNVLCERGLQAGIAQTDVQRVGVIECVGDEVGDGRLPGAGMVACVKLLLLRETVLEVECGAGIHHLPAHLVVPHSLGVIHCAVLWLQHGTHGEQVARAHNPQLQVHIVVLVSVLRAPLLCGVGDSQMAHLSVVVQRHSAQRIVLPEDAAHVALAVGVPPRVLVTGLQVYLPPDGFGVGDACRGVAVAVVGVVELCLLVDGVLSAHCFQAVVVGLRVALVVAVSPLESRIGTYCHVAPALLQAAVDLYASACLHVILGAVSGPQTAVHLDAVGHQAPFAQRVSQRGEQFIRVTPERSAHSTRLAAALSPLEIRAYDDVGERVGCPFGLVLQAQTAAVV